jgi:transcription termination factor Rho
LKKEFKLGNIDFSWIEKIANKEFSAIDLTSSSTRRDDLLLDEIPYHVDHEKILACVNPVETMSL